MTDREKAKARVREQILDKYVEIVKKKGLHPTVADLTRAGITRDKARHHFVTMEDLRKQAKLHDPKAFKAIIDGELFTPKNFKRLKDAAAGYRRFVVTTVVTGCSAHKGFLDSIKHYCKINNAMLLLLPSSDPAAIVNNKMYMDPLLKDEYLVFSDLALNKKLFISSIKLSAKHIDPITGLGRIGQRNGSFIYASPKQRLKMTPTSNKKLPHAIMTTGAITRPDYKTDRYMSDRTAYLADHDHVIGAVIVEILNEKRYQFRQVQADKSGAFADLGVMYKPNAHEEYPPEAIALGDWHSGETDESAKSRFVLAEDSVTTVTKALKAIVHDGFNGLSINHHEIDDPILRAQRAAQCQLSLKAEIQGYVNDLNLLTSQYEEVVIDKSNHDDFFYTYLKKGFYKQDPHNFAFAVKVLSKVVDTGMNPVKAAVELVGGLNNPDKIRWLDRDEDYKIAGIECGAHGDKGANGARGSLRAMENAYGNSVSGHAHTPEILRGAWQVGTLSRLKLNYNEGPSSWMHTSCLIYPNGMRQLINVIDGKWRLDDSIESCEQSSKPKDD